MSDAVANTCLLSGPLFCSIFTYWNTTWATCRQKGTD